MCTCASCAHAWVNRVCSVVLFKVYIRFWCARLPQPALGVSTCQRAPSNPVSVRWRCKIRHKKEVHETTTCTSVGISVGSVGFPVGITFSAAPPRHFYHSRGDRFLSHSSRHTQVPVPATSVHKRPQRYKKSQSLYHDWDDLREFSTCCFNMFNLPDFEQSWSSVRLPH